MGMNEESGCCKKMGMDYHLLQSGCCGMAGYSGYKKCSHYDVSIKAEECYCLLSERLVKRLI